MVYVREESDVSYMVCEEFDGKRRRCYDSQSYTIYEHALETLKERQANYDKQMKRKCNRDWAKEHKLVRPYLVKITLQKVEGR